MTRTAPVLCVMLLTALTTGCAKKASSDHSAAPGEADTGDELAMLEQQLTQREGQLQAIGVAVAVPPTARLEKRAGEAADANVSATVTSAGSPPATAPSEAPEPRPDEPGDRCTRVCEISTAICALEDQICGLLPRHPGEARYQAACERSSADCQLATEACHACTGN